MVGFLRQGDVDSEGERLFARYAFAPNQLGYCGPADAESLFELGVTGRTDADVARIASGFSGAWPYLTLLAGLAGIDDPLDERVVRAYWTGGPLLDEVDRRVFGVQLIELIGSRAGQYWQHLTPTLLPEAVATHGFHVFGVYPWSRMLDFAPVQALHVLDDCRIRWGEVVAIEHEHVVVMSRRLSWDGVRLGMPAATEERVRRTIDGRGFVESPEPGEWLALHWDWVCDRLSPSQCSELERWTTWQLDATNARLAARREVAS